MSNIIIETASRHDLVSLWEIFRHVVQHDNSHGYARDTSIREMQDIWLGSNTVPYKAIINDKIVGTFIIRPAYEPRAAQVGNASYMVHPDFRGQSVGKAMAEFSLQEAKNLGYESMLFKAVVSSNKAAVALWKRVGFEIIATVPKAYQHAELGGVDLLMMYRDL